jgi:asparagine synthase (glutamine-hydrolysing)
MPGILAIGAQDVDMGRLDLEFKALGPLVIDRKTLDAATLWRFVNPKFLGDKVFQDDADLAVAMDGVVFNFRRLAEPHGGDRFAAVKSMYAAEGDEFFKAFRGEFSGILYDKRRRRWLIFVNPTGSKPLYYYHAPGLLVCSSQLDVVTQALRALGRKFTLDVFGAYCLLTYGFMLEDHTLISEVKRLRPGCYLTVEGGAATERTYLRLGDQPELREAKADIIERLDVLFQAAVVRAYEKDAECGYDHLATLSGGLDSRMNFLVAYQAGYKRQVALTFAQNDYLDEQIAKQITSDLKVEWLFYSMSHGHYLEPIFEHAVRANGGLVLFAGSAHLLSAMRRVSVERAGMLHMGQLGDAVLGSYLRTVAPRKAEVSWGAYSTFLLDRIAGEAARIIDRYPTEYEFLMYNRGFNGILNGNWTTYQFTEVTSPFLDPEFLAYAMRIPRRLRYKEQIYTDWIIAKRPLAARYKWEKIRAMVTDPPWLRRIKRYWWMAGIVLGNRWDQKSMNPFDYWYRSNPSLRTWVEAYWNQNSHLLDGQAELKKDAGRMFQERPLLEKTQVMTLLAALRMHFG